MSEPNVNGSAVRSGPIKSRIDRRLVVYPALYVALALLTYLVVGGHEGKLRESVADGLVNITLFIVLGVLVARGGERVLEHYTNIRFGSEEPSDPRPPLPIQELPGGKK
jgi:hypothetical protein